MTAEIEQTGVRLVEESEVRLQRLTHFVKELEIFP